MSQARNIVGVAPGYFPFFVALAALCSCGPRDRVYATSTTKAETPPAVPTQAEGVYYTDDEPREVRVLIRAQDSPQLYQLTRDGLGAVQARPSPRGFSLTSPPKPDALTQSRTVTLLPPRAGGDEWQLESEALFTKHTDPFATKVFHRGGTYQLRGVDTQKATARLEFVRNLAFLRGKADQAMEEAFSYVDPDRLKAWGGKRGVVIGQVEATLEGLATTTATTHQARLRWYLENLTRTSAGDVAMWPLREDGFLIDLIDANWQSSDQLTIANGIFATFELRKGQKSSGIIVPDPTTNNAHAPETSVAPRAGKLTRVGAFFVNLTELTPESKPLHIDIGTLYPVKPGSFAFSLYVDARGQIVGAVIVGYMFAETLARVDSGFAERQQLILPSASALSVQAE